MESNEKELQDILDYSMHGLDDSSVQVQNRLSETFKSVSKIQKEWSLQDPLAILEKDLSILKEMLQNLRDCFQENYYMLDNIRAELKKMEMEMEISF